MQLAHMGDCTGENCTTLTNVTDDGHHNGMMYGWGMSGSTGSYAGWIFWWLSILLLIALIRLVWVKGNTK